ncbi:MAG: 4Fe-4S cluster-binding domain-containing protein [Deltaproteobacteria bacterium]|nr:4Fe-4S cluster-binding domain-containing protein [Deltaproteobacteria bacterium]
MNYRDRKQDHQAILRDRAERLAAMLCDCTLCPRRCRVNRLKGEKGFCGIGDRALVSSVLAHHGEEPPISGSGGAGTIFFASCNLRCRFCQNYQISHRAAGTPMDGAALADEMLRLQDDGCHNIEAVTATPQVAALVGSLSRAVEKGLSLPLVYNCGGYEDPDVIDLLEGIVDVYLPDLKFGLAEDALRFTGVEDYVETALAAIGKMLAQVGPEPEFEGGIMRKGMIIRHLVLPGSMENSRRVLRLIREHLSAAVPLSIMSQYTPVPPVADDPVLGRRVTRREYEEVVNEALDLGFEYLFVQEVSDLALAPDFDRGKPFQWAGPGDTKEPTETSRGET